MISLASEPMGAEDPGEIRPAQGEIGWRGPPGGCQHRRMRTGLMTRPDKGLFGVR
ncbi:hypothetical protein Acsp02_28540 [Actinoplanes sp. NBRC 103695]|nr:hypothetical protein Acsp02_28540 [Actinoplanes sp. NBRC 103695]